MGNGESSDKIFKRSPPLQFCTGSQADAIYQPRSRANIQQCLESLFESDRAGAVAEYAVGPAANLLVTVGVDYYIAPEFVCQTQDWANAIAMWSGKPVTLPSCIWLQVPTAAGLISAYNEESKRLTDKLKGLSEALSELQADLKLPLSETGRYAVEAEQSAAEKHQEELNEELNELNQRRQELNTIPGLHGVFYITLDHKRWDSETTPVHCLCSTDLTKDQLSAVMKAKPKFHDKVCYVLRQIRTISQLCVPPSILEDWERKELQNVIRNFEKEIQEHEAQLYRLEGQLTHKRQRLHELKELK